LRVLAFTIENLVIVAHACNVVRCLSAVVFISSFQFSTLAFSAETAGEENELGTINVIAETEAQTGDVPLEEHTGSHQRINKRELERHDVNLGDILANESGVQFRQLGGFGTLTTATLRGGSSQQTSVFLDGVLLTSGTSGTFDLAMLELLNIESVDVYRGSTPMQLSHANIGGAINLQTVSGKTVKPVTRASLVAGSFHSNKQQFAHRSSHGKWDVVAAASRENSRNDFSFINDNSTPLNPDDDKRERRNNAQVTKLNAMSRFGVQWNNSTRSDFLIQATGRDLGIPEWLNSDDNEAQFNSDAIEFQLTNRFDGIGDWNTSLTIFQHQHAAEYQDLLGDVGLGTAHLQSSTETNGIKTYWERIGEFGTWSFAASYRAQSLDSIDKLESNRNYDVQRQTFLSSAQYAHFAKNERLLITPSLHVQTISDNYNGISRPNRNARDNTAFSPQLGLRFNFTNRLSLRSNIGRFHRQPSFSELFSNRGLIIGNTRLQPEEGTNADFGLDYAHSPNNKTTATLFVSWRDELIALAFDSQGVGRSVNTGEARIYGAELSNELRVSKTTSVKLNATYQRSLNKAANQALNNKEIPGEARLAMHAKLRQKIGKANTWIETNFKSDHYYDQANLLPAKAYWMHNAGVDWQLAKMKLGLVINNIGDETVEDFNGFPRPGRSLFFSLNYQL